VSSDLWEKYQRFMLESEGFEHTLNRVKPDDTCACKGRVAPDNHYGYRTPHFVAGISLKYKTEFLAVQA
jgi:hypothetical protein